MPTWTGASNAMAIARIGLIVGQQDVLPPIGPVTQRDRDALQNLDGLVGIDHDHDQVNTSRSRLVIDQHSGTHLSNFKLQPMSRTGPYLSIERQQSIAQLDLGAEGAITSRSASQRLGRPRKNESSSET